MHSSIEMFSHCTSAQSNDDDHNNVKIIILMLHLLSRAMNLFLDQANASRHHSGEKFGKNVSMKNTYLIYQLHSEFFSLCTRSCVHSSFVSVDLLMPVYTNIILVCGIVWIKKKQCIMFLGPSIKYVLWNTSKRLIAIDTMLKLFCASFFFVKYILLE